MSSIHKLGIIGVRSYSPEEEVVIKFFKPLTLILGKNGAGKTTILECLKMAVSGNFPPNSQGGKTFICDPKLMSKPEVKAKIEIAFTAVNLRKVLGVRTFQLTNTPKKSEFRQMEQVLKTKDHNGDVISVTQKCAEMDRIIPELLGVSQAVLDNVIFCHQEESLWPFGDTAKLKSIFDELFETTKYTNLLDNLKKVQKDYKKAAKDSMNKFELEKKDFEYMIKSQKTVLNDINSINDLEKQLEETQKKIDSYKEKMKPVDAKNDIERGLNIVRFRISETEKQREVLVNYFETSHAQVFTENTIEDLIRVKEDIAKNYKKKDEEAAMLDEKLEALRKQKDALQKQLEQIQHLEKDQSEISIKIKDYRERILQLVPVDFVGNETDIKLNEKVLVKAQSSLDTLNREVTIESQKLEESEQSLEGDLNNFRSSLSSKEGLNVNDENELRNTTQKIARLVEEISKANKLPKGKNNVEEEIEAINNKIENLRENLEMFNESVTLKTKDLVDTSEQITKNAKNKELLIKFQDYSTSQKEYKNSSQEYETNENEIWMLSKNLSDISNMKFQQDDNVEGLVQAIRSYEGKLKNEKEVLENKREKSNDTIKEINSFLQIKQGDYHEKAKVVQEFSEKMEQNQLQSLLDDDADFLTKYRTIKDKLKQAEKRELAMKYTEELMMKLYESSKKNSKCSICARKLVSNTELELLEEKCKKMVAKSVPFTGNEQKSLDDLKSQKALFKTMKNEYEEYRKNKSVADTLRREIQSKEKEKTIAQQQFNNLTTSLTNIANIQNVITDILKVYEKLDKAQMDKIKAKSKIDELLRAYPSLKEFRSAHGLVGDDKGMQEKIDSLKNEIDILRKRASATDDQIQRLQQQKEELDKKKMSQQRDSYDVENKAKELEGLKKRKTELEESSVKIKDEIVTLKTRIEGLEEKRKQMRNTRKLLDEKKNMKLLKLKELVEEFKKLFEIFARSQDKKKRNTESDAQKERLSKEIQAVSDSINEYAAKLQKIKDGMKEREHNLKLVDDNLKLKELEKELEGLEAEKESLSKALGEIMENEKFNKQLQIEMDREFAKSYQSEGKYSVLKNNFESTIGELKSKWSNTEKAYIEKLFEANVNQYVVEDLDIYIDQLERALMLFHKQKMEEINKIIADLWIKTYQGSDIRKIEIKSDTEPNSRNKSFNYRIVFFNPDGKELDMKGRCSMGQKVIASIVIRLGLAEAFCTNCGILALDEPTTNLDKDHIKKLAKELCSLIEEQANNDNFQLIVITHDKDFLRLIGEHSEEYYRVYKDNNSFSKIERKRTSTL